MTVIYHPELLQGSDEYQVTTPGFYPDLTYRGGKKTTPTRALTYSGIKILRDETPADFIAPRTKKTKAMDFGTIVHKLALDKGDEFTISPYDEFRTKEAKAWRDAAVENGETIIKPADLEEAEAMAKIVKERIKRVTQGAEYQTEVPFYWQEGDTWCSGMADVWCPDMAMVVDPKVTGYIHGEKARSHMFNMGWPLQAAWYMRGIAAIMPELEGRVKFANLLIKPDEPYTSRLLHINETWRTIAEGDCLRALDLFNRCTASGEWPGYGDEIEYMDPPTWAMREFIENEMAGDE